MKLHLGCGPIYLQGYKNIDVNIPGHYLAADRPDLVEINQTTVDNYYKYSVTREDIESGNLHRQQVVVDNYGDIKQLLYPTSSVSEIRLVQVFEHFTFKEGKVALEHWFSVLKPGGKIHLDVPDLEDTCQGYAMATNPMDKKWFTRLLFGSQKNVYGLHKSMYSKESLTKLLEEVGFKDISILPNIHFYPAFAVEARKP